MGWLIAATHGSYVADFAFLAAAAFLSVLFYFTLYIRESRRIGVWLDQAVSEAKAV
jgi:hypothetical protein